MKIVKIVGIIFAFIILAILVGGFIFLKTVDVDQYLPLVAEQVKKSTGRDLKISNADLHFSLAQGISLSVSGLSLSDASGFSDQPFVTVDQLQLGLDLKSLILARKIQVGDVLIVAPRLTIIRNQSGQLNVAAMSPVAAATAPSSAPVVGTTEKAMALPALLVDRIKVTDAKVNYIDEMLSPRINFSIDHLDILLKDLSLNKVFAYELKAAVLGKEQNFNLSGKARLDLPTMSVWVTDLRADMDLAKVSIGQLHSMLPMASPAGLKDPLRGTIAMTMPQLRAGANGIQEMNFSAELANGALSSKLVPFPVDGISVALATDKKDLILKSARFQIAGGEVKLSGQVGSYLSQPSVQVAGTIHDVDLDVISKAYQLPTRIQGNAHADFQLSLSGKTPEEMTASLKMESAASLKDGAIQGGSLVEMALAKIPIPGLWQAVQSALPTQTQDDLKKNSTVIESSDILVRMSGMTAAVERAELVTRDVWVSLKGKADLLGALDLKGNLYIQRVLADALIKKVSDLEGLRVNQGQLDIPFRITGPLAKPKAEPDVEYLTKKLLASRGKEVLKDVLEKNPEVQGVLNAIFGAPQPKPNTGGGASTTGEPQSGTEPAASETQASQAVDMLLNNIFKKKD